MSVAIIDDAAALEALAPEWAGLWQRSGVATPFQHPAWLLPWWAAFGSGAPRVATYRIGGELAGVLPAYVLAGAAEGAKLLPIGIGTTDYLDALGEGVGCMVPALLQRAAADGVSRFDLMQVPPGSALLDVPGGPGWRVHWQEGEACPVLTLPQTPPGIRRKLRMSRHRAERAGGWSVEDAGPAGLDTLVALHQARWRLDGEPGVLTDPTVLRFHRSAGPLLAAAGLLRLSLLRVGGAPAAAALALLGPGRIFFYLSGYDAGQAFVSPGTLLLGAMLEQAALEGRDEAHFLRGREAYKYAWGGVDRCNTDGSFRLI